VLDVLANDVGILGVFSAQLAGTLFEPSTEG
jgi:hypothetical protein